MQIAGADGNLVLMGTGLAAGETVVTAGLHALTEGQKLRWYAEPGAALAPSAASAVPPAARPQPGQQPSAPAAASR